MRTNEERKELIRLRAAEIKAQQVVKKQKRTFRCVGGAAVVICCALLTVVCKAMPEVAARMSEGTFGQIGGTASIFAGGEVVGYVLTAIFAFTLGVCLTTLMHIIHRRNTRLEQERKKEPDSDE